MFWRKQQPSLTNEAYQRWLRAQRPPLEMFLGLSEIEQEQLAMLGDEHVQDLAIALGYAVRDPEAADAGMSAMSGDVEAEATLATRLAQGFASKLMQMQRAEQTATQPVRRSKPTMSGFGDRRTSTEQTASEPSLWGVEAQQT